MDTADRTKKMIVSCHARRRLCEALGVDPEHGPDFDTVERLVRLGHEVTLEELNADGFKLKAYKNEELRATSAYVELDLSCRPVAVLSVREDVLFVTTVLRREGNDERGVEFFKERKRSRRFIQECGNAWARGEDRRTRRWERRKKR